MAIVKADCESNKSMLKNLSDAFDDAGINVISKVKHVHGKSGLTAIAILDCGRISIDTYTEENIVYVDCLSYGSTPPEYILKIFTDKINGLIQSINTMPVGSHYKAMPGTE